ncbi:unnamed protein product [Nezara viridula]|uniref:Uncharacterized protein n=1 Tax=Nezara viridula TaxID=85310 RepID=A0A9P0E5U5_NEZVI|nr:unnamed protein product [Nezara viridula]
MTANSPETSVSSTEKADIPLETKSVGLLSSSFPFTQKQLILVNSFPWMDEFFRLCYKDMTNPTARGLEKLMIFYHQNISQSVKEDICKPNRCAKLRCNMGDVLIFFHMSYSDNKPPFEHSSYLAKMSDLMALYMDLEIKASRSGNEILPRIASRITSCLNVFFGRSHDYILDTILKTKMIAKSSWELCDLIFRRVLRECPGSSAYVLTFIRYILAFKLWKVIVVTKKDKITIQSVAEIHLKLPPLFREKISVCAPLRDILPRIPKARTDIVTFLLEAKYSIKDKIKMFLKAVDDPKVQCALDHHHFSPLNNSSISAEKEDNDNNLLMNDWSNMSIESDIGDSLLLNKIIYGSDNKKLHKLKNGLKSISKNEIKKKYKKIEIPLEDIGEDDKESSFEIAEDNTISVIKPEDEEIIKKDQINPVDSVCEGDTMEVAAEVELPSSPTEFIDFPTIKLEPQPSQGKDNMVYPWVMPNMQSYYRHNSYDYGFDPKSEEYVADKTPENLQTGIFESISKHEIDSNKGQIYSSVGNSFPPQGLGIIPSEKVMMDTKSIDALRARGILYEKCFPSGEINIPIEERNDDVQSEEIPLREHNEQLPFEEHNDEEMSAEELDVVNINPRCFRAHNEESLLEECIEERTKLNDVDKTLELNRVMPIENNEKPPEKGGLVHDFTLRNDNIIYRFHLKLTSYIPKLNKRSWINLLYPLFSEQEIKTPRCSCPRCTQNFYLLIKYWKIILNSISQLPDKADENGVYSDDFNKNILKEMIDALDESDGFKFLVWESEIDEVYKKIEEIVKEENEHSNLPLKKRKAFSFSSFVKEEESEMSYPNIPMMSIVEFKEKFPHININDVINVNDIINVINLSHPTTTNAPPPPINYTPDYISHPTFPNPADIRYDNVMVQSNITNVPSDQNPVPGAFTTTFIPELQEQNRPKFKTPAQLKEFQHLSAAEDLINFSLTSRAYCNENEEPRMENEREKKKTRQKSKSSRKRKRTT